PPGSSWRATSKKTRPRMPVFLNGDHVKVKADVGWEILDLPSDPVPIRRVVLRVAMLSVTPNHDAGVHLPRSVVFIGNVNQMQTGDRLARVLQHLLEFGPHAGLVDERGGFVGDRHGDGLSCGHVLSAAPSGGRFRHLGPFAYSCQ